MTQQYTLPFNARLCFSLLSIALLLALFYVGRNIFVPILLALLFAVLLRPVSGWMRKKMRMPLVLSAMLAVTLMVLCVAGILVFISWQITDIASDWGKLKTNINLHIQNLQDLIQDQFALSKGEQEKMISDATQKSMDSATVGTTLLSFSDVVMNMILIPIYTFLFLLYRTHFMIFLCKLVPGRHHVALEDILCRIKVSVQSYIVGLIIETIAVSVLTSVGFMIIGLEYAILLGIITGILNLIPYIGILIAGVLAVLVSLTTNTDFSMILGVVIINVVVQLIDNNLLVPMIVSSKVEINAFVSIAGIIAGGALAGISGMFLAIPILAILKVIFDRIPPLEAWGYLLGDDLPKTYQWRKLRVPRYSYENAQTLADLSRDNSPNIFTETTTNDTHENEPDNR